jgi:PadR family transcriptional regulator PadR
MNVEDNFSQLRKGLLEYAVLNIVSARKVYAGDILGKLAKTQFATGEGTLYPLLSRLKREQLLKYDWVESEAGPPRKYYSLTAAGKSRLQDLNTYWKELNGTLSALGGHHE